VLFIIGVSVLLFSNYRRILSLLPQLSSCDVSSETLAGYADRYEIPEGVLRILFSIMEEQGMDCTRANNNLGGQVYRHKELLRQLEEVHSDDPEVLRLRKEARQAAALGAYTRTATLLLRAEGQDLAALATLDPCDAPARAKRRISASATSVAIAGLEEVRLRYIEAAERYRKAAELLPPNNGAKRAEYLRRAASALEFIGSNDRQERAAALAEARSLYEQSLTLYQEMGDKEGQAKILYNLTTRYNTRDDARYNLRYLEESLRLYQETGNRSREAMTLNSLGLKYDAQGDTATALRYLKESLRVSQEAGDKQNERTAAWNIGLHYQEQEDLRMAEPYIRRAVELGIDDVGEGRRRLEKIRAALR
jgi:tetratricopeptide (TPR) repeat protein